MTGQGKVIDWLAMHMHHHVVSDGPEDLHSPLQGFWKAHLWWMFVDDPAPYQKYAKRFAGDKVVQAVSRLFLLWVLLGMLLPALIAYGIHRTGESAV